MSRAAEMAKMMDEGLSPNAGFEEIEAFTLRHFSHDKVSDVLAAFEILIEIEEQEEIEDAFFRTEARP